MKCHECKKKIGKEKIKQTNIKKYGCEHALQSDVVKQKIKEAFSRKKLLNPPKIKQVLTLDEIRQKIKKTNIERYGVEYPSQSEVIKQKIRQTNLIKRGVEYPSQSLDVKNKIKDKIKKKFGVYNVFQSEEIKQKSRETLLIRYNVDHFSKSKLFITKCKETNMRKRNVDFGVQSEDIKNKIKNTNFIKRGVKYPTQSKDVREKVKNTNFIKRGVEYPMQSEDVKEKNRKYWRINYGVEHNMQVPEILEKNQKSAYKFKPYTLPSGKVIQIQGYENFALDILLQTYVEDDLTMGSCLVPKIMYEYKDKTKRYYTDIYILKDNLIIEVKSTYTMKKELEKNLAKRKGCVEQGYKFKFWIFSKKQLIEEIHEEDDCMSWRNK
jgi:hypothetical protein